MNRLRLAVVGIVALVVASSCSVVDPPAITIDDWSIGRTEFLDQLDALAAVPTMGQQYGVTAGAASPTAAVGGSTTTAPDIETTSTAALANVYVQFELMASLSRKLGLPEPSEAELAAARQGFESQLQLTTDPPAEVEPLLDATARYLATRGRVQEALVGDLDVAAEARAQYDEAVASGQLQEQTCIDAILAAPEIVTDPATGQQVAPDDAALATSRAKADALLTQLDGGADFNQLATAESDDTSAEQGGELGCFQAGSQQLPPAVEEAALSLPIGEYSDVLDLDTAYVIIKVRSRGVVPFEDVEEQLVQQVQETRAAEIVDTALAERATELEVWVDPLFGYWDAEVGAVRPPDGAEAPPMTQLPALDVDTLAP